MIKPDKTASFSEKYNIVCFSNQLWSFPLWTNKRHAMTRLSKMGHNVIFVDPPINFGRLFFRQLLSGIWTFGRLFSGTYKDETTTVYSPVRFCPIDEFEAKVFSTQYANKINNISKSVFDSSLKTVLWVYHVEFEGIFNVTSNLEHDLLIYDCVDNYAAFPKYNTPEKKKKVILQEDRLAKMADLVFTTAPGLTDRMLKLNPNTHFTPNVGDFDLFNSAAKNITELPQDIKDLKKPLVGYTGALDSYKFDIALYKYLLKRFPNYTFVLMGPIALKDRAGSLVELGLEGYSNLVYLGTRPHPETPKYFAGFDAYLIPYQLNDYTVGGCFPVKFHEALAAGLPTIVTDLPTYKSFKDVCYISKTYEEFGDNLKSALETDSDQMISARTKVAKDNSWEGKISTMLNLIKNTLESKK